jgi:energy-coupling factor transport system permease protein
MIRSLELADRQLQSPLGRLGPLAKLSVAIAWLVGLALTVDPRPPLILAVLALGGGLLLGAIPLRSLLLRLAPLLLAALGIGLFNALSASAADATGAAMMELGPFRLTPGGAAAGLGLGLRVLAIASVGIAFVLTTEATRLVDALVQVAHLPERFAYGALAAYQAIPRLAEALVTLRQARRIRGLSGGWHPSLLVGLLILAIRHADRLALAMDARAFGSGPRSRYRVERWSRGDTWFVVLALLILVLSLATATIP